MILPDEKLVSGPSGRKNSLIMSVLLLFAIIVVAFFAYLKGQSLDPLDISIQHILTGNNKVKQLNEPARLFEVAYDSKEHPVIAIYKDYIVKCSKDGILLLDKKGRELWSEGVLLGNPLIKTNTKDLLVTDIGGRDIYVINGQSVLWKNKTDENIQNADISEDGFVTVITGSKRYNGEVRVYDNHGIELFRSVIANDFAVSAKISSKDQMVIDLINTSDVTSYTYLKYFDINGKELPGKSLPRGKSLYPSVWFSRENSLFAAGDTSIVCLDSDRNIIWEKQFLKIASACITGGNRLAAAVVDSNGYALKLFSVSGKEFSSTALEGNVCNINAFGSIIAVNAGREINFLTEKGRSKGRFTTKSDIINVFFFNSHQAAVVTKNYVAVLDID